MIDMLHFHMILYIICTFVWMFAFFLCKPAGYVDEPAPQLTEPQILSPTEGGGFGAKAFDGSSGGFVHFSNIFIFWKCKIENVKLNLDKMMEFLNRRFENIDISLASSASQAAAVQAENILNNSFPP